MQSGVIRGHIRNEIQHCQIIALNGCLLILPASFLSSHTDLTNLTDLTDSFSLQATVLTKPHRKDSIGVKIREICEIREKSNH